MQRLLVQTPSLVLLHDLTLCASALSSLLRGQARTGAGLGSYLKKDEGLVIGARSGLGSGQGQ